jgi:chromosome segregation ATPase
MHQLTEEVTFRERELFRLREAFDKAQLDARLCKQKQETTDAELAKVSQTSSVLEVQLRALQCDHGQLAKELQTTRAAKATAEQAAAASETRAAAAEALTSHTRKESEQMQNCHKRLLAEQQAELERLRHQVQAQASELSREKSTAASREQELLREVHAANSNLIDVRTALASEKGSNEALAGKASHLSDELEASRKQNQQLQVNVEELEQMLTESESDRRAVRARFLSLGMW